MIDYSKIIKNEENLIGFIYSYNWNDGFEIPYKILEEKECTIQVALLLFEFADGYSYLETKGEGLELPEWSGFISDLYNRILNGDFKKGECVYCPELTKVQIYKLKKLLSEEEYVFITPINMDREASKSDTEENTESIDLCNNCVRKNYQEPKLCICPMCGEKTLTEELQYASLSLSCSNCGYEVVGASFFPPCLDDDLQYTITITNVEKENKVRVAKLFGINARGLLDSFKASGKMEMTLKIDDAVKVLEGLKEMKVDAIVSPDIKIKFPDIVNCKYRMR